MQDGSSYLASLEAETEIRRQYINVLIILYHSSPWSLWNQPRDGLLTQRADSPCGLWWRDPTSCSHSRGQKSGEFNYADTYTRDAWVLEGFPGRYIKAQFSRFLLQSHSRVDRLKLMLGRKTCFIDY